MYAAISGDASLAQYLLERGADIHATDVMKRSALHKAGLMGRLEFIKLLLPKCQPEQKCLRDRQGLTPVDLAIQTDQRAVAVVMRRAGCLPNRESWPLDWR